MSYIWLSNISETHKILYIALVFLFVKCSCYVDETHNLYIVCISFGLALLVVVSCMQQVRNAKARSTQLTILYMCKKLTAGKTKFNENGQKDSNPQVTKLGCPLALVINRGCKRCCLTEASVLRRPSLLMINRAELHKGTALGTALVILLTEAGRHLNASASRNNRLLTQIIPEAVNLLCPPLEM